MADSSHTALPPRAALSNRDSTTRTRSEKQPRAQTIEVPLDGQPPIWERKRADYFWNPVISSKPDWCWARRKDEVISEEMPVVLAVNDGERPTTALERKETVLVKQNWDQKGKWLHWAIEIDGVRYIAKVNRRGEVRRFMGGPGAEWDDHPFAFLIEGAPSRQSTSSRNRSSNSQETSTARNRSPAVSESEERKEQRLRDSQLHAVQPGLVRAPSQQTIATRGRSVLPQKRKLTTSNDAIEDEEQDERESQLGRGASEEIPNGRDQEPERFIPESPGQSVTHNDDHGDNSSEESDQDLGDEEPPIQVRRPTEPAQSRTLEARRYKLKLDQKQVELTGLEVKKDEAEADAEKGDTEHQSLLVSRAALLAKARRIEARADEAEDKAKEAKEEADRRRGEANDYDGKIEATKV
ncbi:MAG: hypothetical protein L6R38_007454 [Xanthoria sp. 2 TBL-2021]|nr:MAG: hypothetical protein L6R38_007454 [Xanthoria sp. 2 TBL-2021]